jgi:uncharacterized protein
VGAVQEPESDTVLSMADTDGTFDLGVLLTLQEHDTHMVQLAYRNTHLPEDAEILAIQAKRDALEATVTDLRAAVAAIDGRQEALEQKIHDADHKIDSVSKTLYSGTITASRELQSFEADIASLKKHRSELEDQELELLEEREPLDARLATVDAAHTAFNAEQESLRESAAQARRQIVADSAVATAARTATSALVPPATLAIYEAARAKNRGVGVARLEHGTCMACRLKLSAVDLDRIRVQAADAIPRCEECGAILVR